MKRSRGHGVIVCLASALFCACAPTPVIPSGESRVPVNSDEVISQYRERVRGDQRDRVERNGLARQVDALTKQIQELKAYVTLLQLQQQESNKGRLRQVRNVGAGSPPLLSEVPDKATANQKETPLALAVPPIAAVRSDVPVPPMMPTEEGPTDRADSGQGSRIRTGGSVPRQTTRVVELASLQSVDRAGTPPAAIRRAPEEEFREPMSVKLSEREELELHNSTVLFRVSEGKGLSDFVPTESMKAYLTKAIMLGQCIQVRGYTDGEEDVWFERKTARDRAEKVRRYLIDQGFAPLNIDVKVFPIGEHIADNATAEGRAKNRRVEIEFMDIEPASVWPQWKS